MAEFTTTSEYEAKMDPRTYLESYFHLGSGSLADDFLRFVTGKLHKVFSSGAVTGGALLDVGTAPSIYQLLSSCEVFDEVVVTWFTKSELSQLQKWQNKEPDAFDWSSLVQRVCELEGNKVNCAEKEAKLRGKLKKTWHCDLGKSNPLEPIDAPAKFDCITATVCLEAACKNFEAYGLALRRLCDLLKPHGHLLLGGDLGANYYEVGAEKVFSLPVSEKFLKEAISANGYRLLELDTFGKPDDADPNLSDYEGFYFAHAQKLCCKVHDCCYSKLMMNTSCVPYSTNYEFHTEADDITCLDEPMDGCPRRTCECDRAFTLCFKEHSSSYSEKNSHYYFDKVTKCDNSIEQCDQEPVSGQ